LANHEQDQGSGTGPAGIEAHDTEDEGTFRWPSTGLPKLFGQQPAEADEPPLAGAVGEPPAGPPMEQEHALSRAQPETPRAAPYQYRASFGGATFVHLVAPSPPDPDEASGDDEPPWPPTPPGREPLRGLVPPPAAEPAEEARAAGPAQVASLAPVAGPADMAGAAEGAVPYGAAESAQARGQAEDPALAEEPAEAPEPARVPGPAEAQDQAGPSPAEVQGQAGPLPAEAQGQPGPSPAEMQDQAGPSPAEAQGQPGNSAAEPGSPAQVYGVPAAYGHEEYDPPDGYPMAEYHTGAPAGQVLEPVPLPREAPPHWQDAQTADSLTADMLLPARHSPPPSGWRRAIYQASRGRVRPPLSAAEVRRRELVARACTPVSGGHHRVAVLSLKGGVGKTTTVMGLGSTLASLRGDRVIAVDANPDRGTLSDKLRLETAATVRDLLNERGQMQRYADVRAFTSQAPSRLEVLASDRDPTVSVAFSDQDYEDVSQVLEHYYSICITDCGTGLLHSAMAAVLRLADQIVLVSSPSVDGARSASATLDWLQAHGYSDLVTDAVVVLSVIRPRSKSAIDLGRLEQHFATRCRAVIRIPYDAHLEEGAEVDLGLLSKATADAYLALAAEVGDGFTWPHRAPAAADT
jgi:MinD-like ATPase involved in chromosome partitioning or flagellar assembly